MALIYGSVPSKPKRSIKGRKIHPHNLDFSVFFDSLRWPWERRDHGQVKKSSYQKNLSSIGRNLSRFVKTHSFEKNETSKKTS